MDKAEIQNMVEQMINAHFSANYSSGTPKISPHRHNGIDNFKINYSDLIGSRIGPSIQGKKALVAGTFTVSDTRILTTSLVFVSPDSLDSTHPAGVCGFVSSPGTVTVDAASATDVYNVFYLIIF